MIEHFDAIPAIGEKLPSLCDEFSIGGGLP
jgi:hypothetical protein